MENNYVPTVPSAQSAHAFLNGEPDSGKMVVRDFLGRAAIIYLGMRAFSAMSGEPAPKNSVWLAGAGALAIEAFLFSHISAQAKEHANGGPQS